MSLRKEFIIICWLILFLVFIGFLSSTKEILTGEVGKVAMLSNELKENEYLLYVNQPKEIDGKLVELLEITDSKEIRISVDGSVRSISDKIIVNDGLQMKKNVAIKEDKKPFAVLEIIKVEQDVKIECRESDNGNNIYVKGICYDNYYEMGVEDFCDDEYLREYYCEYDGYSEEVHCMRETVKCEEGCREGKCVSKI